MKSTVQDLVKERYGQAASVQDSCCSSDCGDSTDLQATRIGYSRQELESLPVGANLGLGCGNPLAFAEIKRGDTVLDLGSGAGMDCFLASQRVGPEGHVIGVDMTPEMIERATENKGKIGADNVEFRQGLIESLPVKSASVDLVISNCVINLSVDKPAVFREAYRVLKPGGVLQLSDIVLTKRLPWFVRRSVDAYVGCVAGASKKGDYLSHIRDAGFSEITIMESESIGDIFPDADPDLQRILRFVPLPRSAIHRAVSGYGESVKVRATKPTTPVQ